MTCCRDQAWRGWRRNSSEDRPLGAAVLGLAVVPTVFLALSFQDGLGCRVSRGMDLRASTGWQGPQGTVDVAPVPLGDV